MAFERSQKDTPAKNKYIEDLVNEIRPYEQLIAAKLDQLPVPDMADGIWSDIERELDAPAGPPNEPASAFTRAGWFGLAAVVVAALLLWYFAHKTPATQPPGALPATHAPAPVEPAEPPPAEERPSSDKPAKKKIIPVLPVEIKKDTAAYHAAVPIDSVHADSVVKKILPDVDLYAAPPAPAPAPGGKKHKGVKGITDDDYKISAGKDSGKKKN